MQSKKNITELKKIKLFRYQLDEAYQEMQKGKFQAALQKADKVMNEIVKMIIQHEYGIGYTLDNISVNIKICEREQLLGKNKRKRLIFRYDRKIPDYFSVVGAP